MKTTYNLASFNTCLPYLTRFLFDEKQCCHPRGICSERGRFQMTIFLHHDLWQFDKQPKMDSQYAGSMPEGKQHGPIGIGSKASTVNPGKPGRLTMQPWLLFFFGWSHWGDYWARLWQLQSNRMLKLNEGMSNQSCHITTPVLTATSLDKESHRAATNYANLLGEPLRDSTTYLAAVGCSVHYRQITVGLAHVFVQQPFLYCLIAWSKHYL